jgi:4-amino-4-deoxy-L-arabinose transferase-like glycosyltransferase
MSDSRKRIADAAFLLALMIYILAGVAVVPAHGDEYMQTAMAVDTFSLLRRDWNRLAYHPPVAPNSETNLRLINGSINKTLIGIVWMLSGRSVDSLPGIYNWEMPVDWNQREGNVPDDDSLHVARLPSVLLAALGVIPVFLLGWQLRLRSLAYPAAMLYALHPVILLNGRRAMMEGSLMLFTLLTMSWLLAVIVAEHSAVATGFVRRLSPAARYGGLGVLIGLTIASKYTGLVVAASVLLAALIAGLARDRSWRPFAWVGMAGLVGMITWFVLNPGYWNNPLGALQYTIEARQELLTQQASGDYTYTNIGQRLQAIITEPFLTPAQFYEAESFAGISAPQIAQYQNSTIDGWDWGPIIGLALTVLAGIGLVALIYDSLHRDKIAWAVLIWAAATVVSSLAIPFAWQRYYIPLILVAIVLAGEGLGRLLVQRTAEEKRLTVDSVTPSV